MRNCLKNVSDTLSGVIWIVGSVGSWILKKWYHFRKQSLSNIEVNKNVDYKKQASKVNMKLSYNSLKVNNRGFSPSATFGTWKKFALAKNSISKVFILCTQ